VLGPAWWPRGGGDGRHRDQGSRFTSEKVLKAHLIKASMDGKWRWLDNVFVERQLTNYFTSHNTRTPQLSPGGVTPDTAYFEKQGDQDRGMMLNRTTHYATLE
jgi:transposase InsO family protein